MNPRTALKHGVYIPAALLFVAPTFAALPKVHMRLDEVRKKMEFVELDLLRSLQDERQLAQTRKKLEGLISLQKEEKSLTHERILEVESSLRQMETRRKFLDEEVRKVHRSLQQKWIEVAKSEKPEKYDYNKFSENEKNAIRKFKTKRAYLTLRSQYEAYLVDLDDAKQIEGRIVAERAELESIVHQLKESESLLRMNQRLQSDYLVQRRQEHQEKLSRYHKLRSAESELSQMMNDWNARVDMAQSRSKSAFYQIRGKMLLPIEGIVTAGFGSFFDPETKMNVFRRGLDLKTDEAQVVRAVHQGKVAFQGELPHYGKVVIIDHGEHFYSVIGNMGSVEVETGQAVLSGSPLGKTSNGPSRLYFELRANNVPINPMQWIAKK